MNEAQFQAKLIKRLKSQFPGCVVLKNDSTYQQGMLDLTILYLDTWAALEVKISPKATIQPNQEYFVTKLDDMSFAAFIDPVNEEDVFFALQEAFTPQRRSRLSKP